MPPLCPRIKQVHLSSRDILYVQINQFGRTTVVLTTRKLFLIYDVSQSGLFNVFTIVRPNIQGSRTPGLPLVSSIHLYFHLKWRDLPSQSHDSQDFRQHFFQSVLFNIPPICHTSNLCMYLVLTIHSNYWYTQQIQSFINHTHNI